MPIAFFIFGRHAKKEKTGTGITLLFAKAQGPILIFLIKSRSESTPFTNDVNIFPSITLGHVYPRLKSDAIAIGKIKFTIVTKIFENKAGTFAIKFNSSIGW